MNAPFLQKALRHLDNQPADTRVAIAFEAVSKIYPARAGSAEVVALADVTMAIPEGEIVGVIGRSGAGKSTLIRLVNALERPTEGRVLVDGVDVTVLNERDLRKARRSIGMIFQHFNLLSSRSAYDNIALPLEIAGHSRSEIEATVTPLLDMVGLSDKRARYPAELSGGQKQRVGIARALATRPKVLLSDEATSALDPETTEQILDLLKQINRELNLTILFITHEMSVVKRLADRVAVIESGRIVEQGDTQSIFSRPVHATTRRFVNSVMGADVPSWIGDKLSAQFIPGGKAILRLSIGGSEQGQGALFAAAKEFDLAVEILHGRIDAIAGRPFGTMIASVKGDPDVLQKVIERLRDRAANVEHLGYVT